MSQHFFAICIGIFITSTVVNGFCADVNHKSRQKTKVEQTKEIALSRSTLESMSKDQLVGLMVSLQELHMALAKSYDMLKETLKASERKADLSEQKFNAVKKYMFACAARAKIKPDEFPKLLRKEYKNELAQHGIKF